MSRTPSDSTIETSASPQLLKRKGDCHDDPSAYFLEGLHLFVTVLALAIVQFLSALDTTIVSTALPSISTDFNDYSKSNWVVSVYTLTYCCMLPFWAKLSDIFGRKPTLIIGAVIFIAFSGGCAAAQNIDQLIILRALQGVGASAIYALVVTVMVTIVPFHKAVYLGGVISLVWSLAAIAGPLLGGVLSQSTSLSWRWCFLINVPIGTLAVVLLVFALRQPQPKTRFAAKLARMDWAGCILIVAAIALILAGIEQGAKNGPESWGTADVLPLLLIGLAIIPLFVWVEMKIAKEPVTPMRLFANRNTAGLFLVATFGGLGFFVPIINIPAFLEYVGNVSPTRAGVMLLPAVVIQGVLSAVWPPCVNAFRSFRPFIWVGCILAPLGVGLLALACAMDTATAGSAAQARFYGFEVVFAIGHSIISPLCIVAMQLSTTMADRAVSLGLVSFFRIVGATLGLAIANAARDGSLSTELWNSGDDSLRSMVNAIRKSPEDAFNRLTPAQTQIVKQAFVASYRKVFIVAGPISALGLVGAAMLVHQAFPNRGQAAGLKDQEACVSEGGDSPKDSSTEK